MIQQLGYVGLSVRALEPWLRLMVDAFGLECLSADDRVAYLRVDDRHHRIHLSQKSDDALEYVGWQVDDQPALASLFAALTAAGVPSRPGSREEHQARKVAGMIVFEDPSGYRLEAFFGPSVPVGRPFRSGTLAGFRAGVLGLGHILATAKDVKAQEDFYTRVLGFRVSDYAMNGGVFLRCNARHHSVAFHPTGSFGVDQGPQLRHLLVEVNEFDDVGRALDVCKAMDVPVAVGLGRHSNDLELSFYAQPSGKIQVEYGCDGRLVDDESWVASVYSGGDLWGHRRADPGDREAHRSRLDPRTGRFPWLAERAPETAVT